MRYFIYCRKSSEDKNRQIQSIDDQKRELLAVAKSKGLSVIDVIFDEKSAKSPGRKGFSNMIARLHKKEANGILCWKLDRLARNPVDGGSITWLLQQGIIEEIITPDKTYYPTDNVILMGIEFGMANQYVIDLRKNVARGMKSKIEKGWLPTKAPMGYKNEKDAEKGKKRILPDPEVFPLIQNLWKRLIRDRLSLADLYRVMEKEYPIYRKGDLIAFSSFHRIFHNPFYAGMFVWNGEKHIGSHAPMVTMREFEKAQQILSNGTSIRQSSLEFDLKGLFSCGCCGGQITAERHSKFEKKSGELKEYDYYRCSHRKKGIVCKEAPLSEKELSNQIVFQIESCEIPEEILAFGLEELRLKAEAQQESEKEKVLKREIITIDQRLNGAIDIIFTESDAELRSMMKEKINELKTDRKRKEADLLLIQQQRKDPYKEIRNSLELAIEVKKKFLYGTVEQKRNIVHGLGLNWEIQNKNLYFKPYFTISAIQRAKLLLEAGNPRFEPMENRMSTTKNPHTADLSFVWSG